MTYRRCQKPIRFVLSLFALLAFAFLLYWLISPQQELAKDGRVSESSSQPTSDPLLTNSDSSRTQLSALVQSFHRAQAGYHGSDLVYQRLKSTLWAVDPHKVGDLINDFLSSGVDCPTGLEFQVGDDGFLESAPTMRTAMLDMGAMLALGELVETSLEIVRAMRNPDEVALALRNLQLVEHEAVPQAVSALLSRKDWARDPSDGFLEAFDIVVALDDPVLWRQLAALVTNVEVSPRTQGAAAEALRSLAQRTGEFPALLAIETSVLASIPNLRGEMIARLSVAEAAQVETLRRYLMTPVSSAEAQAFMGRFPNLQPETGPRLVSRLDEHLIPLENMAWLDLQSEKVLLELAQSGQLATPFQEHLQTGLSRLSERRESIAKSDVTPLIPTQ